MAGTKAKIGSVIMGPENIASDVRVISEFVSDSLFGDAYTFHFGTGVTFLSANQKRLLKSEVVPLIVPGGVVGVYGLADRTGSQSVNYDVSGKRLVNFSVDLERAGASLDVIYGPNADWDYYGEDYLESVNSPNDKPSFYGRCVAIFVWPNVQSANRVFSRLPFIQYTKTH